MLAACNFFRLAGAGGTESKQPALESPDRSERMTVYFFEIPSHFLENTTDVKRDKARQEATKARQENALVTIEGS